MSNTKITFYPVANGDTNLIEFSDGVKMMQDCKFRTLAEDDNDDYDVIKDLLENKLTTKKHGLPYLNAFVLTHPDQDHCLGFSSKFFHGKNPETKEPTKEEKDNNLIFVGELWYSPRVFTEYNDDLCEDAKVFKEEAERRMKLWKNNDKDKNKSGNRIRIIGYTDDESLKGIPTERITTPGNELNEIDGKNRNDYRFFIHAPFKDDIDGESKNETSIVMHIRIDAGNKTDAGKIMLGGDAEWRVWDKIMDKTADDKYLNWNIFEAPHHCSYTYFADSRDDAPNQSSLDFLDKMEGNGYIISSSKTIKKNPDNPPCQKAKNRYIEHLKEDEHFLCTEVNDTQEPVVFEIKSDGIHLVENDKDNKTQNKRNNVASTPHYYG
ncbi:MAG: hypothetical protein KAZ28_00080 [Bacteroidaceae bacterium]|nr:hypothetical protein [Bacteroidaceae bacterium]